MRGIRLIAIAAVVLAVPLAAQNTFPTQAHGVRVGGTVLMQCDANGANCSAIGATNGLAVGWRESPPLIVANTPSAPATVFGGDYILSQACTSYGTLNLQVLGPDATTWLTILSKTSSDAGSSSPGGTGMSLGSYAQVRITVTGTTGCNAILARVPA